MIICVSLRFVSIEKVYIKSKLFMYIFTEAKHLAPECSVNGTTMIKHDGLKSDLEAGLQFPSQDRLERQWSWNPDALSRLRWGGVQALPNSHKISHRIRNLYLPVSSACMAGTWVCGDPGSNSK